MRLKALLIASLLALASKVGSATPVYVQVSPSSTQSGSFLIQGGTVTQTMIFPFLTAGSFVQTDSQHRLTTSTSTATPYIQNTSTLQPGATFYVSSGTVVNLSASSATVLSLTASTATISAETVGVLTATSSSTFKGAVVISSSILTGASLTPGTSGQVMVTGGNGALPFWGNPMTDWVAYTPTLAGVGTATGVSFFWRQIGNTIFVRGVFTVGVAAASTFTISLPNSTTINTSHVAANFELGRASNLQQGASASFVISDILHLFTDGSINSTVFGTSHRSGGSFAKDNGNTMFTNGDTVSVDFSYPI